MPIHTEHSKGTALDELYPGFVLLNRQAVRVNIHILSPSFTSLEYVFLSASKVIRRIIHLTLADLELCRFRCHSLISKSSVSVIVPAVISIPPA
jgi:hypothetical protein